MGIDSLRKRIPAPCALCGGRSRGGALCAPCKADVIGPAAAGRCIRCALALNAGLQCPDCALRVPAYDYAIAAFDYAPPADALVLQLKQSLRWALAGLLGELLAEAVRRDPRGLPPGTTLVPVPSTTPALRRRGFNPAAEIARAVGRVLDVPVRNVLAPGASYVVQQSTLSRVGRQQGAHGKFQVRHPVAGMAVALVDDVMTTGSTLHAAALALREAGAGRVVALAVARTPHIAPARPSERHGACQPPLETHSCGKAPFPGVFRQTQDNLPS